MLDFIMWKLKTANTPPIYPPPNYELLSLRLKIYKKHNSLRKLSHILQVPLSNLYNWCYGYNKPRKRNYNLVMNYLEKHG